MNREEEILSALIEEKGECIHKLSTIFINNFLRKYFPGYKYCSKGLHFPLITNFASDGKRGLKGTCKDCYNEEFKIYYDNNRDRWRDKYTPVMTRNAREKLKKKREFLEEYKDK
jgi:hypothetical protein